MDSNEQDRSMDAPLRTTANAKVKPKIYGINLDVSAQGRDRMLRAELALDDKEGRDEGIPYQLLGGRGRTPCDTGLFL